MDNIKGHHKTKALQYVLSLLIQRGKEQSVASQNAVHSTHPIATSYWYLINIFRRNFLNKDRQIEIT